MTSPILRAAAPGPLVEVSWGADGPPSLSVDGRLVPSGAEGLAVWSDSESPARIAAAWRDRGLEGLGALRGAFALVLVDSVTGQVIAARDPLGLEPLFHGSDGTRVWLSSDLARLTGPDGPRALDQGLNRVVLAEILLDVVSDVRETVYRGIGRLPGGCARVWRRPGEGDLKRIWDPLPTADPIPWHPGPSRRVRDELEERLDAVVSRHLARCGSAETGIFLSAGIDSVTLAALARRKTGPAPLALSLSFPHPSVDESAGQRHVAAELGLDQVLLSVPEATRGFPGDGPLAAALAVAEAWPQPLLNLWLPAYGTLARRGLERGIRTIWTGTGGDEWLSVTPLWAAELWRRGRIHDVAHLFRAYARSQRLSVGRLAANLVWRFGLRSVLAAPIRRGLARRAPDRLRRRGHRRFETLAPPWLIPDPAVREAVRDRLSRPQSSPEAAGEYLTEMRRGLHHPIPSMEMEETWEAGRRVGVAWEHPLLDADLVGWLARVHPDHLLAGGWSKGLARDLLENSFPELGVDRMSKPHATEAFHQRISSEGPGCLEALGPLRALEALGLVAGDEAAKALRSDLSATTPLDNRRPQRVWQILLLEAWLRGRGGMSHNEP